MATEIPATLFTTKHLLKKLLVCLTLLQMLLLFVKIADSHKHLALKVARKLKKWSLFRGLGRI